MSSSIFASARSDVLAGSVVFLVALPLCLGIAVACGVPPVSGLIAGVIGGVVVPMISRAPLSVSGPAAGLTSVVLAEVVALGSLEAFLTAVMLAGVIQAGFGLLRIGWFSSMVPAAVVKGMLAAIGLTIVLKQLPVAFGVKGGLADIPHQLHSGAAIIALVSLLILYGWKYTPLARFAFLPPALVAVAVGGALGQLFGTMPSLSLTEAQFVQVPLGGLEGLMASMPRPHLPSALEADVWIVAITLAAVASIETLLSLQAVDRLDPHKRHSPPDRELVAQGVGNLLSGFLGGLPVTSVIVRSSANVAAGGQDRLSTIVHGVLLFAAVILAGSLLNQIPLACLAAVLLQVGMNLAKPSTVSAQFKLGYHQALPFVITIGAVLALGLLEGVIIGVVVGVLFVLRQNTLGAIRQEVAEDGTVRITFRRDVTFLTKPLLMSSLDSVPDGARLVIVGNGEYVDQDVKEALVGFHEDAHNRDIHVEFVGISLAGASSGGH